MLIDLSKLIKGQELKKNIHIEFEKEKFFDGSEYIDFSKPVIITGRFSKNGDVIEFKGQIETELILNCSRCLERFRYAFDAPLEVSFTSNVKLSDEHIFIDSEEVEFDSIVESCIIFEIPFKRLCKDDCKGLCPYCGVNLNYVSCNCKQNHNFDLEENEEDNFDPRFAKLKDLFKNN